MEALVSCFSSSTTRGNEAEPRSISQPLAYRGEAKEAVGLEPLAECHSLEIPPHSSDLIAISRQSLRLHGFWPHAVRVYTIPQKLSSNISNARRCCSSSNSWGATTPTPTKTGCISSKASV